jgi:phosphopantothenoylcysteine decarboxylase/phosphopantothenate--cysteine ligase
VVAAASGADAVVMAAAPADFRPLTESGSKIKKSGDGTTPTIELAETPDILAGLVRDRDARGDAQVVVGFAAETGDDNGSVLDHARAKLARKGCDLLVVNDVSGGKVFGSTENEAVVLDAAGETTHVPRGAKSVLAHAIWDRVAARLATG